MRYLLLSDIHANITALEAVLAHAQKKRWGGVIFLGDAVGYYPDPNAVLATLRDLEPMVAILGNHDALALAAHLGRGDGGEDGDDSIVGNIARRHAHELTPDNLVFLQSFIQYAQTDRWEAVHGALRHPWEYLATLANAQANLALMKHPLCFFGHTHTPVVYACVASERGELWRAVPFPNDHHHYRLPPKARVFFNPGSVGQPRDGVPRASYAIFDEEAQTLELFRVPFDIALVQRRVYDQGYPEMLARRLEVGR